MWRLEWTNNGAANKDRQKRNIFDLAFLTLYNVFSFECFFLN